MKIAKFKIENLKRGITPIELIIVIAVLAIIVAIVLPQFAQIREEQVLKGVTSEVLSALNKARLETISSYNSSQYGVHFEPTQIVIFRGTSYSSGAADNEIISITSPASITNVTFGDVSSVEGDVYFNRLSGAPSTTGTVTVSTSSYAKTITINASGAASMN